MSFRDRPPPLARAARCQREYPELFPVQLAVLFQTSLPEKYQYRIDRFRCTQHPFVIEKALQYFTKSLSPELSGYRQKKIVWEPLHCLAPADFAGLLEKRQYREPLLELVQSTIEEVAIAPRLNYNEPITPELDWSGLEKTATSEQLCSLAWLLVFHNCLAGHWDLGLQHIRVVSEIEDRDTTVFVYLLSRIRSKVPAAFYRRLVKLPGYTHDKLVSDAVELDDAKFLDFLLGDLRVDASLVDPLRASGQKQVREYLNRS